MMENFIITIGRQAGSGGREIGMRLAQRLGIPYYGRQELMQIAKGTPDYEEVQSFYEEQPVNSLLYALATINSEDDLGRIPFQRIRQLCGKTSCVLIGRCGGYIFRGQERAVSIFLHADEHIRAQRTMEDYGVSMKKALEQNQKTDSDRAAFHRYYTREEWGASADYHLCLDSGVLGVEGTVEVILAYLKIRGIVQ